MSCKILLETAVCHPGSYIKGKLHCDFNGTENIRAIKIRITGVEHTEWYENVTISSGPKQNTNTHRVLRSATNVLFKQDVVVFTGGNLAAGWYEYDFNFKLPDQLPSSYNSTYGYVNYTIKGIVDRPNRFDYTSKMGFVVLNVVDLNRVHSNYHNPVSLSDDKTVCCMCCKGGIITLHMDLDRQAFVIGETAIIKVRLNNRASVTPKSIKVEILQEITAFGPGSIERKKYENKVLAKGKVLLAQNTKGEYDYEIPLHIPNTIIVYNFIGCTLWESEYILKATCVLSGWHTNLSVKTVPVLGYIPIEVHQPQPYMNEAAVVLNPGHLSVEAPPPYTEFPQVHMDPQPSAPKDKQ